ncbi:MAG: O-antigen ligase family protein [Caulobacterales bacterium]|nr:O-antigen ligase family protein [Caulobacterales bacterium]
MTANAGREDRLSRLYGGVLVGAAGLTPLLGWFGPLGFAPLLALAGLLCLPALRLERRDGLLAVLLLSLLAWAALSTIWSRFHPRSVQGATALKLAFQLLLYGAAVAGARRADPRRARMALQILAWGLAALGVILAVEALSDAALYRGVRAALHTPMEFPYARKNLAQGSFVLALLWPVAAAAGARAGAPWWLAIPMALGAAVEAHIFLADAPVLAVGLAVLAAGVAWTWPDRGPKAAGLLAVAMILLMPFVGAVSQALGLAQKVPLSWAERLGYWDAACRFIGQRPRTGWGLDASRTFTPLIQLHPHNGALQLWLELGVVGAALAALVWLTLLWSLAGSRRDSVAAGAMGSAAVYLLFGLVSFGIWQEWWLALGALVAVIVALSRRASPISATPTA